MVLGQDVVAEGGLDVEEGGQRQAGEAAVLLVFDLAVSGIAEGGAQDTDGAFAVALDFEVNGVAGFDGLKIPNPPAHAKKNIYHVWLQWKRSFESIATETRESRDLVPEHAL